MAEANLYFRPVEVAMLILGYMTDKKLTKTLKCFIRESKDLAAYYECLKSGKNPDLTIGGYDLLTLLEEFAEWKLSRLASGEPVVLPAAKENATLKDDEVEECIKSKEADTERKQQQRGKDKIRNAANKDRRKELREKKKQQQKAAEQTSKVAPSSSQNHRTERAVQVSLEDRETLSSTNSQEIPESLKHGGDIVKQAACDAGIREETRDGHPGDVVRAGGSQDSVLTDRSSAQSRGSEEDLNFLNGLLEQTHLPERLAAYINQELGTVPGETCTDKKGHGRDGAHKHKGVAGTQSTDGSQAIGQTGMAIHGGFDLTNIVDQATSDPAFQDLISMLQRGGPATHTSQLDPRAEFSIPVLADGINDEKYGATQADTTSPAKEATKRVAESAGTASSSISDPTTPEARTAQQTHALQQGSSRGPPEPGPVHTPSPSSSAAHDLQGKQKPDPSSQPRKSLPLVQNLEQVTSSPEKLQSDHKLSAQLNEETNTQINNISQDLSSVADSAAASSSTTQSVPQNGSQIAQALPTSIRKKQPSQSTSQMVYHNRCTAKEGNQLIASEQNSSVQSQVSNSSLEKHQQEPAVSGSITSIGPPFQPVSPGAVSEASVEVDITGDGSNLGKHLQADSKEKDVALPISGVKVAGSSTSKQVSLKGVKDKCFKPVKFGAHVTNECDGPRSTVIGKNDGSHFVVPEETSLSVFSLLEREAAALIGKKFIQSGQKSEPSSVPERMTAMSIRNSRKEQHPIQATVVSSLPPVTGSRRRKRANPERASIRDTDLFSLRGPVKNPAPSDRGPQVKQGVRDSTNILSMVSEMNSHAAGQLEQAKEGELCPTPSASTATPSVSTTALSVPEKSAAPDARDNTSNVLTASVTTSESNFCGAPLLTQIASPAFAESQRSLAGVPTTPGANLQDNRENNLKEEKEEIFSPHDPSSTATFSSQGTSMSQSNIEVIEKCLVQALAPLVSQQSQGSFNVVSREMPEAELNPHTAEGIDDDDDDDDDDSLDIDDGENYDIDAGDTCKIDDDDDDRDIDNNNKHDILGDNHDIEEGDNHNIDDGENHNFADGNQHDRDGGGSFQAPSATSIANQEQSCPSLQADADPVSSCEEGKGSNATIPLNFMGINRSRSQSCPIFGSDYGNKSLSFRTECVPVITKAPTLQALTEQTSGKKLTCSESSTKLRGGERHDSSNCTHVYRCRSLPAFFKGIEGNQEGDFLKPNPATESARSLTSKLVASQQAETARKRVIAFQSEHAAFTPQHYNSKPPSRRIAPTGVNHNKPSPLHDSPFSPLAPASMSPLACHSFTTSQGPVLDQQFSMTLGSPPRARHAKADSNSPGKLRAHTAFSSSSLPAAFSDEALAGREPRTNSSFRPVHTPGATSVRSQNRQALAKKTVITFHSRNSAFTPTHCQKAPSRRIAPTEVTYDAPSPMQTSPLQPFSPADQPLKAASLTQGVVTTRSLATPDSTFSGAAEKNVSVSQFQVEGSSPSHIQSNGIAAQTCVDNCSFSSATCKLAGRVIRESGREGSSGEGQAKKKCGGPEAGTSRVGEPEARINSSIGEAEASVGGPEAETNCSIGRSEAGINSSVGEIKTRVRRLEAGTNNNVNEAKTSAWGPEAGSSNSVGGSKTGLCLPRLDMLGIRLPPSPSKRQPRRLALTQLSAVSRKGYNTSDILASSPCTWQSTSSHLMDESKMVSSSSDLTASQAEAHAFKMLKSLIATSYVRPQPCQEITSTNQGDILACPENSTPEGKETPPEGVDRSRHRKSRKGEKSPAHNDMGREGHSVLENALSSLSKSAASAPQDFALSSGAVVDESVGGSREDRAFGSQAHSVGQGASEYVQNTNLVHTSVVNSATSGSSSHLNVVSVENHLPKLINQDVSRVVSSAVETESQAPVHDSCNSSPASGSSSQDSKSFAVVGTVEFVRSNKKPVRSMGIGGSGHSSVLQQSPAISGLNGNGKDSETTTEANLGLHSDVGLRPLHPPTLSQRSIDEMLDSTQTKNLGDHHRSPTVCLGHSGAMGLAKSVSLSGMSTKKSSEASSAACSSLAPLRVPTSDDSLSVSASFPVQNVNLPVTKTVKVLSLPPMSLHCTSTASKDASHIYVRGTPSFARDLESNVSSSEVAEPSLQWDRFMQTGSHPEDQTQPPVRALCPEPEGPVRKVRTVRRKKKPNKLNLVGFGTLPLLMPDLGRKWEKEKKIEEPKKKTVEQARLQAVSAVHRFSYILPKTLQGTSVTESAAVTTSTGSVCSGQLSAQTPAIQISSLPPPSCSTSTIQAPATQSPHIMTMSPMPLLSTQTQGLKSNNSILPAQRNPQNTCPAVPTQSVQPINQIVSIQTNHESAYSVAQATGSCSINHISPTQPNSVSAFSAAHTLVCQSINHILPTHPNPQSTSPAAQTFTVQSTVPALAIQPSPNVTLSSHQPAPPTGLPHVEESAVQAQFMSQSPTVPHPADPHFSSLQAAVHPDLSLDRAPPTETCRKRLVEVICGKLPTQKVADRKKRKLEIDSNIKVKRQQREKQPRDANGKFARKANTVRKRRGKLSGQNILQTDIAQPEVVQNCCDQGKGPEENNTQTNLNEGPDLIALNEHSQGEIMATQLVAGLVLESSKEKSKDRNLYTEPEAEYPTDGATEKLQTEMMPSSSLEEWKNKVPMSGKEERVGSETTCEEDVLPEKRLKSSRKLKLLKRARSEQSSNLADPLSNNFNSSTTSKSMSDNVFKSTGKTLASRSILFSILTETCSASQNIASSEDTSENISLNIQHSKLARMESEATHSSPKLSASHADSPQQLNLSDMPQLAEQTNSLCCEGSVKANDVNKEFLESRSTNTLQSTGKASHLNEVVAASSSIRKNSQSIEHDLDACEESPRSPATQSIVQTFDEKKKLCEETSIFPSIESSSHSEDSSSLPCKEVQTDSQKRTAIQKKSKSKVKKAVANENIFQISKKTKRTRLQLTRFGTKSAQRNQEGSAESCFVDNGENLSKDNHTPTVSGTGEEEIKIGPWSSPEKTLSSDAEKYMDLFEDTDTLPRRSKKRKARKSPVKTQKQTWDGEMLSPMLFGGSRTKTRRDRTPKLVADTDPVRRCTGSTWIRETDCTLCETIEVASHLDQPHSGTSVALNLSFESRCLLSPETRRMAIDMQESDHEPERQTKSDMERGKTKRGAPLKPRNAWQGRRTRLLETKQPTKERKKLNALPIPEDIEVELLTNMSTSSGGNCLHTPDSDPKINLFPEQLEAAKRLAVDGQKTKQKGDQILHADCATTMESATLSKYQRIQKERQCQYVKTLPLSKLQGMLGEPVVSEQPSGADGRHKSRSGEVRGKLCIASPPLELKQGSKNKSAADTKFSRGSRTESESSFFNTSSGSQKAEVLDKDKKSKSKVKNKSTRKVRQSKGQKTPEQTAERIGTTRKKIRAKIPSNRRQKTGPQTSHGVTAFQQVGESNPEWSDLVSEAEAAGSASRPSVKLSPSIESQDRQEELETAVAVLEDFLNNERIAYMQESEARSLSSVRSRHQSGASPVKHLPLKKRHSFDFQDFSGAAATEQSHISSDSNLQQAPKESHMSSPSSLQTGLEQNYMSSTSNLQPDIEQNHMPSVSEVQTPPEYSHGTSSSDVVHISEVVGKQKASVQTAEPGGNSDPDRSDGMRGTQAQRPTVDTPLVDPLSGQSSRPEAVSSIISGQSRGPSPPGSSLLSKSDCIERSTSSLSPGAGGRRGTNSHLPTKLRQELEGLQLPASTSNGFMIVQNQFGQKAVIPMPSAMSQTSSGLPLSPQGLQQLVLQSQQQQQALLGSASTTVTTTTNTSSSSMSQVHHQQGPASTTTTVTIINSSSNKVHQKQQILKPASATTTTTTSKSSDTGVHHQQQHQIQKLFSATTAITNSSNRVHLQQQHLQIIPTTISSNSIVVQYQQQREQMALSSNSTSSTPGSRSSGNQLEQPAMVTPTELDQLPSQPQPGQLPQDVAASRPINFKKITANKIKGLMSKLHPRD